MLHQVLGCCPLSPFSRQRKARRKSRKCEIGSAYHYLHSVIFLIEKLLSLFHDVSIRGSHCLCRIDRQVFSFMSPALKRGIYPNQQTELPYILLTPYKLSPGRIETRSRRTTRRETGGREGSIRGETSGRESPREARRRGCKDIRIRSSMHEMPGS